ncbi:MAG TPA: hypothetical protein DDZ80_01445, partial [Cyanobacteria bacterium UBA8803]|nr:hypothetical protein [Cyanobacteria bacterium UBA8803]
MQSTYLFGNNLLVETPLLLESHLLFVLDQVLLLAQDRLIAFAHNPEFSQKMAIAFGEEAETTGLQADWLAGDFSILSGIEIRQGSELNGANGAYGASNNRIYLSEEFLRENLGNLEALVSVVLEEAGHRIDALFNTVDSVGDEGAIFASLVQGESLDAETLQALKVEDDRGIIVLDGQVIQVEENGVDNSDNSIATAINVGTLTSPQTFSEFVGNAD